ncbi:MAG TPA: nucleotidyltransferase family protein [Polyangia bacterium]|nr:nucleotidyltransferase family protein [Polyangia bacterium]
MIAAPLSEWAEVALRLLRRCARATAADDPELAARARPQLEELVWRQIDSLYYLAFEPDAPTQRLYDKLWQAQQRGLETILARLANEGVRPVVIKGAELVRRHYGAHAMGLLRDVDLLVERADLGKTARILAQLGYLDWVWDRTRGGWYDRDPLEAARATLQHYELMPVTLLVPLELDAAELAAARPLCRSSSPLVLIDDRCHALLDVDVHHGLGRNVDVQELFARAIPSAFASARTFGTTDHLWFLVKRSYVEVAQHGRRSLRPFAYLAPLLRAGDVDWTLLRRLAEQFESGPALYYWLSFLDGLADGGLVPEDFLADMHPLRRGRAGDLGWQLAPMFDAVEPPPIR